MENLPMELGSHMHQQFTAWRAGNYYYQTVYYLAGW